MKLHVAALLAAVFVGMPCLAQDDEADAESGAADAADAADASLDLDLEPSRCVSTTRIRRTKVIDNQTVAFYMRGSGARVYVNSLPRDCPGLKREDRFMYEVRVGQLCAGDWITVLERFGTQFQRGFTCPLGVFHPSNADAVALLIEASESGGSQPSVTVTPVEPPAGETQAPAEGEAEAAPEVPQD